MGVVYMFFSSACFATMSAMIKGIGSEVPFQQLIFLRCALGIPILVVFIVANKRPFLVQAKKLLFLRTCFGIGALSGFYFALTHMPLADCVFIGRSQPLLLALFAPYVVGESTPRVAWFAIASGLIGVALIMQPAMAWPIAAWAALGGAAMAAGAQLLVRKLNRTDYPLVIVFNFIVLTAVLTSLWALPGFVRLSSQQWMLISGVAVFATLGQVLMTMAYRLDRAPVVAAASYAAVALSVVYGYVYWGEFPQPFAWLGGGLIIIAGLMLLWARFRTVEPA